jgi:octaprenyl-diphosphate synthase
VKSGVNTSALISLLKPETAAIDQVMRQDLAEVGNPLLAEVLEYAIFNGGKRVRPLLTVLAARLCWQRQGHAPTREQTADLYRLALAFEYLHAASLLHDDVIDRADSRRGRETANRVWDNTHVILAGDFLHTRAMCLAGAIGGVECLTTIGTATQAMVASEFLQLQNADSRERSRKRYFQVLDGKTAALIAAATRCGAIVARAETAEQEALHLFGYNLGLTFQIVDDLLDYGGDPQKTGKAVGNDFQEGKMTLPLILALELAQAHDLDWFLMLLHATADERRAAFPQARAIITSSGGMQAARDQALALVNEATAALAIFAKGPEQEIMIALAHYVLNREG